MNSDITIVTGFFKINRGAWKGFERSDEQYFEYFKLWAKIHNRIVAYVETEEMKNRIVSYRSSLGLGEKTMVEVIDDCERIDNALYNEIKNATNSKIQQLYRLRPTNPESWNADYNYIVLIKAWCVQDAVAKGYATGMVSWLDFGYNHGGSAYDIASNFSYEWKYDFPQDKISVFTLQDIDKRPIFDIIFSMDTYIVGGMVVAPDFLWEKYWNLLHKSALELAACGLADDEQNVILMAYKKEPNLFKTYRTEWSMQLYQFGGGHLILANNRNIKLPFIREIAHKIKFKLECMALALRIYKHMSKVKIH